MGDQDNWGDEEESEGFSDDDWSAILPTAEDEERSVGNDDGPESDPITAQRPRESQWKYDHSDEGRLRRQKYDKTEKRKQYQREYYQKRWEKERQEKAQNKRIEVQGEPAALGLMPGQAGRAVSHKDLPPSVETAYYRKCVELRRRINDIEENNDAARIRIARENRGITKLRLERAFLLEQLQKRMEHVPDDSDRSDSPPPTPTDKPLRSKRGHRQKTPPPGSQLAAGAQQPSPGSIHHQPLMHAMNPMSSAQSTPDPSRSVPFFSTLNANASSPGAAPGAVNGNRTSVPPLPPLHPSHLPPLPVARAAESSRGSYYDPVNEGEEGRGENGEEYGGGERRTMEGDEVNGDREREGEDAEMADAPAGGFTAVNNR